MNNTIKLPQKSSIPPKNPQNTTGLSDSAPTSPIEALLSRIKANFGKISQDKPIFAARVGLGTAQNPNTHQKATANKARCGFTLN